MRAEGGVEVVPEVVDVLDADAHAQQAGIDVGVAGVLLAALDRRLDPAEAGGGHEQAHGVAHGVGGRQRRRAQTNDTIAPVPG